MKAVEFFKNRQFMVPDHTQLRSFLTYKEYEQEVEKIFYNISDVNEIKAIFCRMVNTILEHGANKGKFDICILLFITVVTYFEAQNIFVEKDLLDVVNNNAILCGFADEIQEENSNLKKKFLYSILLGYITTLTFFYII